jgi:ribosome biogenesis protein BMS1
VADFAWTGMRTVAEIRRERNQAIPLNKDSLYKPVERAPRVFNPLRVPRNLQAALPFKSKPKNQKKQRDKSFEQKRAVVSAPGLDRTRRGFV